MRQSRFQLLRPILGAALGAQLLWLEVDVLSGRRFTLAWGGREFWAVLAFALYVAAITSLTFRWPRVRFARRAIVAAAIIATIMYHFPVVGAWWESRNRETLSIAPTQKVARERRFMGALREISAAQEQYRLRHRIYAGSVDSLREWLSIEPSAPFELERRDSTGWSARIEFAGAQCRIWVRDPEFRTNASESEGIPRCGSDLNVTAQKGMRTIFALAVGEVPFRASDLTGLWIQHRADEQRSGTVAAGTAASNWNVQVAGEIKASAAVAGNQVFVGAHGNGELVAISLDRGTVGFRLRLPNWMHHEPVVTPNLVIAAFGNNEAHSSDNMATGSAPSGVAAYDRRTGWERWRRYTSGSVMTSPILHDSIVAVITGAGEAFAWRASDGAEVWKTQLPSFSLMGNPLVTDSLMIVGLELTTVCAFQVTSGKRLYCTNLSAHGWGSGHTSPSRAGNLLLVVFDRGIPRRFSSWARTNLGLFTGHVEPNETGGDLVLVALERSTGVEQWRIGLGSGRGENSGQIAGTPVVSNGVAFIPSPYTGRVTAVDIHSPRVLWSTDVNAARGSVLVARGAVIAASRNASFVVLDALTGRLRCRGRLPAESDRTGPTLAGATAILALRNGLVIARPIDDWLRCHV